MYSDEKSVHALLQKVLSFSQAEQTEVVYLGTESALTRFANNFIHQNVAEKNHELRVRAIVGKRMGVATTNRLDDQSLQRVAEQALEIARLSPENPEFHSLPEPQPIVPAPGFSERTAFYSPEARARSVGIIVQLAKEHGLESAGAFSTETSQVAIANSLGIFAYEPRTESECHAVVMADVQGSGYTQRLVTDATTIDFEAMAREAVEKAQRSRNPIDYLIGEYPVVLDTYATADMLQNLIFMGLSATAVQEKKDPCGPLGRGCDAAALCSLGDWLVRARCRHRLLASPGPDRLFCDRSGASSASQGAGWCQRAPSRRRPCRHRIAAAGVRGFVSSWYRAMSPMGLSAGAEELADELGEDIRALKAHCVAGPSDHGEPGVLTDRVCGLFGDGPELGVLCAHDDEHGHVQVAETLPQRHLGARADGSQGGGQPRSTVAESRTSVGLIAGHVGKQRPVEPCVDEPRHTGVTGEFEFQGKSLVSFASCFALGVVFDPRMGSDDDEALDEARVLEGQMKTASAPERVADISRLPAGSPQSFGRIEDVRALSRHGRVSVTGQVDGDELEARFQILDDRRPRRARLGKAMDEGDPCSGAVFPHMQPAGSPGGSSSIFEGHRG